MKVRFKSYQLLLGMLTCFQVACSDSGSSEHVLPSNQMYDRQTAGQARSQSDKNNFINSISGQSASSYQAASANGTIAPSPSLAGSSYVAPSSGSSNLGSGLLMLGLVGIGSYILGPTLKSGVKSLTSSDSPKSPRPSVTPSPKVKDAADELVLTSSDKIEIVPKLAIEENEIKIESKKEVKEEMKVVAPKSLDTETSKLSIDATCPDENVVDTLNKEAKEILSNAKVESSGGKI